MSQIKASGNYADFKKTLLDSGCTKCPLSRSRTHIVVDRGNPKADVVIIGEAPGEKEDLAAKAFVGRSGQLLDRMMKEIGFDTDRDSLIINVVKCRPPDNRRPTPEEADTCKPFLQTQINLVNPKVILLLGATALKHLAPNQSKAPMRDTVGNFLELSNYPGMQCMVLFHPAYILRDKRKEVLMREHLKHFKKYLDQAKTRKN